MFFQLILIIIIWNVNALYILHSNMVACYWHFILISVDNRHPETYLGVAHLTPKSSTSYSTVPYIKSPKLSIQTSTIHNM